VNVVMNFEIAFKVDDFFDNKRDCHLITYYIDFSRRVVLCHKYG
jgi:hypothetical protein